VAEVLYNKHGWRMDNLFWRHEVKIGSKKAIFLHIDTSFLAYGIEGEVGKPDMPGWFKTFGWRDNN